MESSVIYYGRNKKIKFSEFNKENIRNFTYNSQDLYINTCPIDKNNAATLILDYKLINVNVFIVSCKFADMEVLSEVVQTVDLTMFDVGLDYGSMCRENL